MAGYWPSSFFACFVPCDSTNKGVFFSHFQVSDRCFKREQKKLEKSQTVTSACNDSLTTSE